MNWLTSGRLVLGMACAALFLVGYDGGSCNGAGDETDAPRVSNDLRPAPACGTVCDVWCEHGNVLDENGCPTCACNPDPGTGAGGSAGECPGVVCQIWCEHGNVLGAAGCPTCACNPAPNEPANHCQGLGERACNATSGCLGIYDDSCACSPCPDGVDCFCDCPDSSEPDGAFLRCVLDRAVPDIQCSSDADCAADEVCEPYVTCMAIGCPPPGTRCVVPD